LRYQYEINPTILADIDKMVVISILMSDIDYKSLAADTDTKI